MSLETTQRAAFEASEELPIIQPLRQVDPGDVLQPVKEWTLQFEGNVLFGGAVVEATFDMNDEAVIPHPLGRPITGAVVLGVRADFSDPGNDAFAYAVEIDSSTERDFRVVFDKLVTGTIRFLVL